MADRLRYELGDIGRSFVYQFVADGTTNRFLVPYSPLDGANLVINQEGDDVSTTVEVEEATGYIVFDETPAEGDVVIVAGNYYKYFTTTEICQYIDYAFEQHTTYHTDSYGRTMTIATLPTLEEYPVIVYKIDVFSLRRISKTTNEYVPIFEPQEIDNKSPKTRVRLPIPTYGNVKPVPTTVVQDLNIYEGDDYEFSIRLEFEVNNLTPLAQIRVLPGASAVVTEFTVTKPDITEDGDNQRTLVLSLTGAQTRLLPGRSYYDVQLTDSDNVTHTYVSGQIFTTKEVSE
jgi:hypothetical protein